MIKKTSVKNKNIFKSLILFNQIEYLEFEEILYSINKYILKKFSSNILLPIDFKINIINKNDNKFEILFKYKNGKCNLNDQINKLGFKKELTYNNFMFIINTLNECFEEMHDKMILHLGLKLENVIFMDNKYYLDDIFLNKEYIYYNFIRNIEKKKKEETEFLNIKENYTTNLICNFKSNNNFEYEINLPKKNNKNNNNEKNIDKFKFNNRSSPEQRNEEGVSSTNFDIFSKVDMWKIGIFIFELLCHMKQRSFNELLSFINNNDKINNLSSYMKTFFYNDPLVNNLIPIILPLVDHNYLKRPNIKKFSNDFKNIIDSKLPLKIENIKNIISNKNGYLKSQSKISSIKIQTLNDMFKLKNNEFKILNEVELNFKNKNISYLDFNDILNNLKLIKNCYVIRATFIK